MAYRRRARKGRVFRKARRVFRKAISTVRRRRGLAPARYRASSNRKSSFGAFAKNKRLMMKMGRGHIFGSMGGIAPTDSSGGFTAVAKALIPQVVKYAAPLMTAAATYGVKRARGSAASMAADYLSFNTGGNFANFQ